MEKKKNPKKPKKQTVLLASVPEFEESWQGAAVHYNCGYCSRRIWFKKLNLNDAQDNIMLAIVCYMSVAFIVWM